MIKSGLTAFDRAIEKKYNGTSPNGAGQYYLDWKYNLADEKDYIEQLADENGLSVEFQTDEGYFEVFSSRRNNMKKTIKSSVREHYLLGKQNFLTEHVFGIDDDGDTEYEYDFGGELLEAEMAIFEKSDTGFVGFDIESHRAGKTKTRHEVLDYDGLENKIEGSDIKNGVAIYEDSDGIITVATMGSNWHNSKTGEEGTDYTLFKAVDYDAEPEDEEIDSSRKPIKSSKWVEDVADKKGITFEQVLEVFKDNGYGEDEADDFWNSKWNDVSDAFGEDGIAGLDELFGIEIETEDDDIREDDKDVDYDKYHLDHGEVKTEDFQRELMNTGYSKEDIDYVFGNNKLFYMQYLDKYWQDRIRRELEFRKDKSVTSSRKPIKSGYTGTNVTVEYGPYGEEKDFPFYDMKGETVEQIDERIGYYDEVKTAWGSDGESYMILQDRADSEDKIAVLEDNYNDWVESMNNEDYSKIIGSSKKGEKKMKIQSKRLIKSGTSNFGSNDDIFGYSFPLVTYVAENYYYDEETDSETEERDYDADDWEYRDAIEDAKALADEMNIPQYDDYSEPYLCYEPFMIKFRDGYYEGLWIEVKEGTDETNYDSDGEYTGEWVPFTDEEMNKFADKLNEYFNKLCSEYGWQKLGVTARFSNGETMYHKIDNSRKPIQSANYDGIKKQMQYTLDVLKEDAEDSDEEYAERMGYDGTDAGAVRYAINRFKNEYGIRNRYNVVNQSELADWLAGLPLSFDYANYNILQKGVEWGYLPPIQEGTDLTRKETNWLDNWWNGLANNILKLARKYNVGITSTRKSVTSGLTFRQAVQDFKAAGQWNDYYEMQQDWESYKDGLERDGLISEKTRSTWGNPCTPETFKRWNK